MQTVLLMLPEKMPSNSTNLKQIFAKSETESAQQRTMCIHTSAYSASAKLHQTSLKSKHFTD